MPDYFEVTKVKHAGQREGKFGTLDKFYCEFSANGTPYTDVYWQRKPGNAPEVGQRYYGEIKEGEFGPRFHQEQDPSQTPSAPAQSQASTAPIEATPNRENGPQSFNYEDARQASIIAQSMFKAASELVAAGSTPHDDPSAEELVQKVTRVGDLLIAEVNARARRAGGAL